MEQQVGPYRIEGELARGGMGVVYTLVQRAPDWIHTQLLLARLDRGQPFAAELGESVSFQRLQAKIAEAHLRGSR